MERRTTVRCNWVRTCQDIDALAFFEGLVWPDTLDNDHALLHTLKLLNNNCQFTSRITDPHLVPIVYAE